MSFASILKNLRNEYKLNQNELADKIGISRSSIAMYETGQRTPDYETLIAISNFFNVSSDYLLERTNFKYAQENSIESTSFHERLKLARKNLNYSQKEFAQKLHIAPNTYNGYETGNRTPNLDTLKLLSVNLNVSSDYLLGLSSLKSCYTDKINNLSKESKEELELFIDFLIYKEKMKGE